MKKTLSVAAVALALSATAVQALSATAVQALSATAVQANEGVYVGANFQMADFNLKPEVKEADALFGGKYNASTVNLIAGYDFNEYVAVEGRIGIPASSESSSRMIASLEGKPTTSYAVFGKGKLPLNDMFSLYALVGFGSSPY